MELPALRVCARCQYALAGLGEAGRCPECGEGFDGRQGITLVGREFVARRRPKDVRSEGYKALAWMAVPLGGVLVLRGSMDWLLRQAMGVIVAPVVVESIVRWRWRRGAWRPGRRVMVHLGRRGVARGRGASAVPWERWEGWMGVEITKLDAMHHRLRVTGLRQYQLGGGDFDVVIGCGAAGAEELRRRIGRWQRQALAGPPGVDIEME